MQRVVDQIAQLRLSTDRFSFIFIFVFFDVTLGHPDVHELFRQHIVKIPTA